MSDTAWVVRNVRQSVERWVTHPAVNGETLTKLPLEQREELASIVTRKAFQTGFSDSFVVAFPLQVDGVEERLSRARAAYDLWSALLGLAVMSLETLAQGIPWRAGLDVGIGMEIFPNEVYGPVLLSAYQLESAVAEWPRLVLGRGLLDYLNFLERLSPTDVLDDFAARMAVGAKEFICKSDDGWPMLHILSPAVMTAPGNCAANKLAAHKWIREQVGIRWSAKNDKLFRRYSRLVHYFDAFPPHAAPKTEQ